MAHPYHHSLASMKKWGGMWKDYIKIHEWFDATKELFGDFRHRALRHHSQGIFECERVFGITLRLSTGRVIPVRWVGEQHVIDDIGRIPSAAEWLVQIHPQPWMNSPRKLSKELEREEIPDYLKEGSHGDALDQIAPAPGSNNPGAKERPGAGCLAEPGSGAGLVS